MGSGGGSMYVEANCFKPDVIQRGGEVERALDSGE